MRLRTFSYQKVLSTNNTAIKIIKKGFDSGIVLSNEQSMGKGKYGKKWVSIKGNLFTSIFFSIKRINNLQKLVKFNCDITKKSLNKFIKKKITIKPPNDILIEKKKVCGILQEVFAFNQKKYIVVGIGINIVASPNLGKYKTTYINYYLEKNISKKKIFKILKDNY